MELHTDFILKSFPKPLYDDLIENVPEFKEYDIHEETHYIDTSPLGTIGSWLKELTIEDPKNEKLIRKICNYLNIIYSNSDQFKEPIKNDFCVYLFWVLDYPTITKIKHHLNPHILEDGRKYLRIIDRENYQDF